jgi:hypothetical protein
MQLKERMLQLETALARRWVSSAYGGYALFSGGQQSQPDYFDHHIDLFYQWLAQGTLYGSSVARSAVLR